MRSAKMNRKLVKNIIKCNHCGDVLQSFYVHDFKQCSCGRVFIDGGLDYARRGFIYTDDYTELSEWVVNDEEEYVNDTDEEEYWC